MKENNSSTTTNPMFVSNAFTEMVFDKLSAPKSSQHQKILLSNNLSLDLYILTINHLYTMDGFRSRIFENPSQNRDKTDSPIRRDKVKYYKIESFKQNL